jgi:hypothetical protein
MLREAPIAEALILALVGGVGVIVGARSFAPSPVIAKPAPQVAPPPDGWPKMPEHAREVVKYQLTAKLDPSAHSIDGKGTITLTNVSRAALSDLRLHLYLNAFKNDRTVFRRARVGGFRGDAEGTPGYVDVTKLAWNGEDLWSKHEWVTHQGATPQDPLTKDSPAPFQGAPSDETDVRVPLPRSVQPGETITLEVEFRDQLPTISERTGFLGSFHFAGQWFPKLAKLEDDGAWAAFPFHHLGEFYADYGSYDVTIDVPSGFVVGASGAVTSSKEENGRHIERHVLGDVHDFAFTAWDRFVTKERTIEGVAVRLLGPPGYDDPLERELTTLEHAFRDKNARFGAYPYPVLTVVHPPAGAEEAGGMEYPTLITTGGAWWPWNGAHDIEYVTVHEFGHQWFYGLVGTNEVEWPSGDEGFNSFADELAMNTLFTPGSAASFGPVTLDSELLSRRGVMGPFDEPIFQPVYKFATGRSYGGRIYGATAAALMTLRRVYGPRFDTAMGVWTRAQRFQHPKPEEFFAVLERYVGGECDQAARAMMTSSIGYDVFVEQFAIAKAKLPDGYFDAPGGRQKKDGGSGEGYSNMAFLGRHGIVDLPVDVELRFADGSRSRRTIRFGPPPVVEPPKGPIDLGAVALGLATNAPRAQGSTWVRIDADGPKQLVSVVVDPDLSLWFDRDRMNNFASIAGKGGGAPVTRERSIAWLEVLLRGVGP